MTNEFDIGNEQSNIKMDLPWKSLSSLSTWYQISFFLDPIVAGRSFTWPFVDSAIGVMLFISLV
jgi:hypothetical protein